MRVRKIDMIAEKLIPRDMKHLGTFHAQKITGNGNCLYNSVFSEVKRVIQLVLVMPATNATSERSFSTLRRVKNYLRSTMKQERLNYMMLLNVHTNMTDDLQIKQVLNEFVGNNAHRSRIFSKY